MKRVRISLAALLLVLTAQAALTADRPAPKKPLEALQAFNELIGEWRGTGQPEGTREEKQRGFWTESLRWRWQFKGDDAWLVAAVEKGKHFTKFELRYLPDKDLFQLTAHTTGKEALTLTGPLKNRVLTLEREDEQKKETQRLVISLLHETRFLYRYEVKPQEKNLFARVYQVGCTNDRIPFAGAGSNQPECVVSGGLGTMKVSYKGQDYYVCCTGCRDAFNDNPEKYIKEFAARKAKEAKEKGK
jgi:hypothetical protein